MGKVKLTPGDTKATVLYTINGGKAKTYDGGEIDMRGGGTIKAWYKNNPRLSLTATYEKVENVPLQVVFASSQEPGSGDAAHLVDGDPATIWHRPTASPSRSIPTGSTSTQPRRKR